MMYTNIVYYSYPTTTPYIHNNKLNKENENIKKKKEKNIASNSMYGIKIMYKFKFERDFSSWQFVHVILS